MNNIISAKMENTAKENTQSKLGNVEKRNQQQQHHTIPFRDEIGIDVNIRGTA